MYSVISRIYLAYFVVLVLWGIIFLYVSIPGVFHPVIGVKEFSVLLFSVLLLLSFCVLGYKYYHTKQVLARCAEQEYRQLDTTDSVVAELEKLLRSDYQFKAGNVRFENGLGQVLTKLHNRLTQAAETEAQRNWVSDGIAFFADKMRGKQSQEELAREIIVQLCKYIGAEAGIFYGFTEQKTLPVLATYCLRVDATGMVVHFKDGLVGEVAASMQTRYLTHVPEGYLQIQTGLGQASPAFVLLVPMVFNDTLQGVVEIATFQTIEEYKIRFVERLAERIAATLIEIKTNVRTREMLLEARTLAESLSKREKELTALNQEILQAQKEISATQAQLQNITESVPQAIYQLQRKPDGSLQFQFLSSRANDILLCKPDILLKDFYSLPLVDSKDFEQALTQSIKQNNLLEWEGKLKTNDNTERWVKFVGSPQVVDAQGTICWNGTASDITFERAAKEALRINDRALSAISSGIVILDMQKDGYPVIYANPAFFAITGYTQEEVLGKNIDYLHSSDIEQEGIQGYRNALVDACEYETRLRSYRKDGQMFWNNAIFSPVRDENGLLSHFICAFHDVTEQTQADLRILQSEKMAALGQLIAGVAHEINTPLGVIKGAADNMLDFLPNVFSELPSMMLSLPETLRPAFAQLTALALDVKPSLSTREQRQLRKNLQEQLEAKGILQARTFADNFATINLVDDIEPFVELLQYPDSSRIVQVIYSLAQIRRNLGGVQVAVDKTRKIVFALKSYAHAQQEEQHQLLDLRENLDMILTLYHNQLKQGVNLQANFQEVPMVLGSADELSQVWTNLIMNAIQAMKNEGDLIIELYRENGSAVVAVTDNGPGIPPHVLSRIFEPFFTTKPQGEGTGLGLDICKRIIEKHKGKINVDTQPGKTTFTVHLPIGV